MHDLRQRNCPISTPTHCKKRVATAWLTHHAAAGRFSPLRRPIADSSDLQNGKVPATERRVRWYMATRSEQGISKLTHVSSPIKIRAISPPGPLKNMFIDDSANTMGSGVGVAR